MKIRTRSTPCPTCGGPRLVLDGAHLREIRKAAGLSLREMSRRLGISPAYLSDVELRRRGVTSAIAAGYEELADAEGVWPPAPSSPSD